MPPRAGAALLRGGAAGLRGALWPVPPARLPRQPRRGAPQLISSFLADHSSLQHASDCAFPYRKRLSKKSRASGAPGVPVAACASTPLVTMLSLHILVPRSIATPLFTGAAHAPGVPAAAAAGAAHAVRACCTGDVRLHAPAPPPARRGARPKSDREENTTESSWIVNSMKHP